MGIKESGSFELYEVFELLDKALFALENIPDIQTRDGEGGTTKSLGKEIRQLFEGCDGKFIQHGGSDGCENKVSAE